MKKRIFLWLLAVAMPMVAWCYTDGETFKANNDDGIEMTFKVISEAEKTCQVGDGNYASISTSQEGELIIPNKIQGYKVVALADYSFNNCKIAVVEIPSSVKSIGTYAFNNNANLQNVYLKSGLESIGGAGFGWCKKLTSITLPNSLKSIGDSGFEGCENLETVKFSTNLESLGESAFENCTKLQEVHLYGAFTTLGKYAFRYCENLQTVEIEGGITSFGMDAFDGCNNLVSASLGEGTEVVGTGAFYCCGKLESVSLPSTLKAIYGSAFYCCYKLNNITLPYGLIAISPQAFYYCSSLTSIIIPNSVTNIYKQAFKYCTKLESIQLSSNLEEICDYTFEYCGRLTNITIPSTVNAIGSYAFNYCSSLNNVIVPQSVTSIGRNAFANCTSLVDIFFEGSPAFGVSVFSYSNNLTNVYYPAYAQSAFSLNDQVNKKTLHPYIRLFKEWGTYCATASFDVPEGLEAYVVDGFVDGVAQVKRVNTINRRQGVLLKVAETSKPYEVIPNSSAAEYDANMLKGVLADKTINAIGSADDDEENLTNFVYYEGKFYKATDGTAVKANTAYLQVPTADLKGDEPSIETVIDPVPDDPSTRKCATPVITYEGGQLKLACETKDVEFKTTIKSVDVKTHYTENIAIGGQYSVTAIATKAGYLDSDEATLEISLKGSDVEGDLNGDKEVTITDAVKVVNIILNK